MVTRWFTFNDRCKAVETKRAFARQMRKAPTPAEAVLWRQLKAKQLGCPVKRQRLIMGYIVDFYIPRYRLVIEVDGYLHNKDYDATRDKALARKTFKTMRFSNYDVINNTSMVIKAIKNEMAKRPKFTSSNLS